MTVDELLEHVRAARLQAYEAFLAGKVKVADSDGFACEPDEAHPRLKPHQRDAVAWAVRGGRRALFLKFGLGKTLIQLEIARLILAKVFQRDGVWKKALIVCPLNVRGEFQRDAQMIQVRTRFIRTTEEAAEPGVVYITNYESVREGKVDPREFEVVSLDEAAILRGFGATKTFRELMAIYEGTSRYRFVATATPSPNEYLELASYSAFLDIMDVSLVKTRFFQRNSTKADNLTLRPHQEAEFFAWLATWALFVQTPSELGHSDDGYVLPEIEVHWHELPSIEMPDAGEHGDGQRRMFRDAAMGVVSASREKRSSIDARIAKVVELLEARPDEHVLIWHDLESERHALTAAIPDLRCVWGSQPLDAREELIRDFSDGAIARLGGKPCMLASGCNFQRFCAWEIFVGIGFKFADFIQAIHRVHRFLQPRRVRIDLVYTEAERGIRAELERKWREHNALVERMSALIREYGLTRMAMACSVNRKIGVERAEISGDGWRCINNDSVLETAAMPADSIDLVVTSIPFANMYEYSPSYNDFGHSEDNDMFWRQMDFLTPELFRALKPGRLLCLHVKDRIDTGGRTGFGFQTLQPLHAEAIFHYQRHGFALVGQITIATDVVRENNQTNRLGYSEFCKDGSRIGVGVPEYILMLRKPQTDRTRGYADVPVEKSKDDYSLARWQTDAHGFWRSSGNRLLTAADLVGLDAKGIYRRFNKFSLESVYDYEHHVGLMESLGHRLPTTFMLLPPHAWHEHVWTDVARMRTLNMQQAQKGAEHHLCPLQFDIVNRLIVKHSMEGEVVYDPFGGLGTVAMRAVALKRQGITCELATTYWAESVNYVKQAADNRDVPTFFDLLETEQGDADAVPEETVA